MNHGSLFSGIGGFDLAARWMGWNNIFHVERDPFCQKVLKHHFPESESFDDIKEFKATPFLGRLSILSGGFPCQPFSSAGKRRGTSDNRHLWPEMLRVIRESHPRWVVGENVHGLLSWSEGLVFSRTVDDLEGEGYEVFPVLLPASSVGAPHLRNRIWFCARNADWNTHGKEHGPHTRVQEGPDAQPDGMRSVADSDHAGNADGFGSLSGANEEVRQWDHNAESGNTGEGHASHPHGEDRQRRGSDFERKGEQGEQRGNGVPASASRFGQKQSPPFPEERPSDFWADFPSFSPLCGTDDGLPTILDGITLPKWRRESLKAYGNAIVPQVAYQIFRAIVDAEQKHEISGDL